MIRARYMEIRSRKLPGQPTETIIRTVNAANGRARKTIRVLRRNRTVSLVTEPLTPTERSNIQIRRFTPDLYASQERKTLKRLRSRPRATKRTRKTLRK